MLKRILMLLMTLLLLALPAGAEDLYDQIDAALYQIVLRTDAGDKLLGSGVLFVDASAILTAEGCCKEGALYAVGLDGEYAVESVTPVGSGAALLTLASPATASPRLLAPAEAQSLPFIFGTNADGERGTMPLYKARVGMRDGLYSLLFASEEGLLPGAFLTDEQGRVTALITNQQMEGLGSYAGLGADALGLLLSTEEKADTGFLDCTFAWEDGELTISWTDKAHTEGVYVVTLVTEENQYYTTYVADITERSLAVTPPPGHTYGIQVQRAASEAEALEPDWNVLRDYTLPLLPFPAYGMQAECAILSLPAGSETLDDDSTLTAFTAANLTDPARDIYLRADCSYTIPTLHTANLTLELIAPDGQFFFDEQIIDLDPADAAADSLYFSLNTVLDSCVEFSGGALQAGDHTLRFFLDGCIGGEYTFTVTEEGAAPAAAPAEPATEGFVSGLGTTRKNGLVTLTWDAASIPEGAKVRAYYLYDSNPYYVYLDPDAGANSVQVFTVPGHQAAAWVTWSTNGEFTLSRQPGADEFVLLDAAPEEPITAHSFRNVRIGLAASADPKAPTSTDFLPQAPITREMLTDRATPIYFMTEDTYQVGATSGDHPLLIVLETPDGMCFVDLGYYIFDRSLQSSDLWVKDISKLFADYESFTGDTAWPAGEYRILYCIDEKVAGEIKFTLE
ncbi:MAG: hypothetical protein IJO39_09385 [Clostridia bacterium]|nr:hypothetical protein [Clostridia bacterium]